MLSFSGSLKIFVALEPATCVKALTGFTVWRENDSEKIPALVHGTLHHAYSCVAGFHRFNIAPMAFALRARFWSMALAIWSFSCFAIGSAAAAVNNPTPTSGQTVTVDTSPPNPDTTGVHAVAGSTNVTVNILQGAQINVANNNAVVIRDQSQISNQGAITNTASLTFDGIDFGSNNTITNS